MNWVDWLGTASYLLLAVSYLVTSILWLRVLAIIALTMEGAYFYWVGEGALWVGIAWVGVFNAINLTQLAILLWSRAKVRMSTREHQLRDLYFAGIDKVSLRKLTSLGSFRSLADQAVILRQGQPVSEMAFLLDGRVLIFIDNEVVEILRPPAFLGEISFLTGRAPSVTAITACESHVFVIAMDDLRDLAKSCEPINTAIHKEFAITLAHTVHAADEILKGLYQGAAK